MIRKMRHRFFFFLEIHGNLVLMNTPSITPTGPQVSVWLLNLPRFSMTQTVSDTDTSSSTYSMMLLMLMKNAACKISLLRDENFDVGICSKSNSFHTPPSTGRLQLICSTVTPLVCRNEYNALTVSLWESYMT